MASSLNPVNSTHVSCFCAGELPQEPWPCRWKLLAFAHKNNLSCRRVKFDRSVSQGVSRGMQDLLAHDEKIEGVNTPPNQPHRENYGRCTTGHQTVMTAAAYWSFYVDDHTVMGINLLFQERKWNTTCMMILSLLRSLAYWSRCCLSCRSCLASPIFPIYGISITKSMPEAATSKVAKARSPWIGVWFYDEKFLPTAFTYLTVKRGCCYLTINKNCGNYLSLNEVNQALQGAEGGYRRALCRMRLVSRLK